MSDLRLRPRRAVLFSLLALCAGVSAPALAADAYPDKPIRLIVPYPPGGATDVIGRVLAQELTGALGQTVVVENRGRGRQHRRGPGRWAPADGYTLVMGALTSHSINAALYRGRVTYDVEKSFAPVSIVGTVPLVFVVNPSVQAKTLAEFIALAKSKPGFITMASAGNGSPQHLAGEMFKRTAGVDVLHVPYKGSGPAMTDLMGGQVLSMIETVPAAQANIKAGKAARAGGDLAAARGRAARRAHGGRGRAEGLRGELDVRHRGAGQYAGAGGGPPERRTEEDPGQARGQGVAAEPGRHRHLDRARRGRRPRVRRACPLDQSHRRSRREGRLSACARRGCAFASPAGSSARNFRRRCLRAAVSGAQQGLRESPRARVKSIALRRDSAAAVRGCNIPQ